MISMPSPAAVRAARTAASPAATSARSIRIFTARKPAARAASTASARSAGLFSSPNDAYAGTLVPAAPNRADTGCPAAWPMMSHRAASSGQ